MKLTTRSLVVAALVCGVTLVQPGSASANKCSAGKVKCVVNKTKALLGCHGKAAGKGLAVDAACIQKAKDKFDGGAEPAKGCFEKLEAKGEKAGAKPNVVCPTSNDTAALEAKVDAFVADLVADLDTTIDPNKCVAGKTKCATTKAGALLGCHAKAFGKDIGVDAACIAKAKSKFDGGATPAKGCFEKLEIKGEKAGAKPAVVCPTTDDTAAIEAKIDAFVDEVVCALEPAGCVVATPTITPTPTVTPTPDPNCGNGALDSGEQCDTGVGSPQTTCPNVNTAAFPCNEFCTCDCPTRVTFSGDATDPASILDTGWTGISHRAPIISNGDVTINLACTGVGRPCGVCNVSGPVANPNAGAGQLDNQRCSHDSSIKCASDAVCGVGNTCEFYFGAPLPLAAGGVTACVFNQFNGQVSGTANVETGEASTAALLTSRVYTGIAIDNPCARCIGDGPVNDGVAGGTCDGGTRGGLACDGNGTVFERPDFGTTSLDCPLSSTVLIATLPIDLTNATDPVTKTVSADSPTCSGVPGERCICDTCNNSNQEPCFTNADCPDPAGPIGPICGGRRCIGGSNAGTPCAANSECSGGGFCNRPGEPTKPSACLDDSVNTVGVLDCSDTAPVDGEGECTVGPITQSCSVASGHPQRGCTLDAECGGAVGSCVGSNRLCFLTGGFSGKNGTNTLIAVGMEDAPMNDTSNPTLGAVFCVGPTGSTSINNVSGLPGPGRVTINGTATGLP